MNNSYLLRVFGEPQLLDGAGARVAFTTRRQIAILTFLVLDASGRSVRRTRVAELFWPDVDGERSNHSLSQAISDIRRVLGRDAVVSRDGFVVLQCDIKTELEHFAEEAGSLAGLVEPLREFEGLGGVSLAHWLDATRAALNARLRGILQRGLAEKQAGGNLGEVRQQARLLYRADAMSDEAVVALAEDALLHGDGPGAIHLLRTHASRIKETCGGKPGPGVVRLMRTLESGEHRTVPQLAPIVHMVGREREMAVLQGVWSSIRNGGSVAALITGVPGIGKTTLIESFLHSVASRKWHCYSTRCHEMGRRIPYSAIADIVHLLASEPEVAGTDPALLAEASRVAPELNAAYPGIPAPPRADPDSIRLRVAGALYQMLFEVTEGQPVLVTFDDIHNMDQASREVLYVLYHRMRSQAAMFLGSARSPQDGRVSSRSDVMDWQSVTEMGPLDRSGSCELLDRIGGSLDERIKRRILELGQDNPHLIEILVTDSRENGKDALVEISNDAEGGWRWRASDTMNRALAGLLFGLTAESQRLLDLISIVERPISVADAAAITGSDESTANHAGFELIERGLVRFEARGLAIKNELHRLYIHSRMNPDIRRFLHARVVRHVTRLGGEESSLELVHHLLAADSVPEAIDKVVAAARAALAQGAPAEAKKAILSTQKSDTIAKNPEISFLLGKAMLAQGDYRSAIQLLSEVPDSATFEDCEERSRLLAEATFRGDAGTQGFVLGLVDDALRLSRGNDNQVEAAKTLQLMAEVAYWCGDDDLLSAVAQNSLEIRGSCSDPAAAGNAIFTGGFFDLTAGRLKEAVASLELARSALAAAPPDAMYRRILNGLGIAHTGLGEFAEAESAFREALSLAVEIGESSAIANTSDNLGVLLYDLGRYTEARACFDRAIERSGPDGTFRDRAFNFANAAVFEISQGGFARAKTLLEKGEAAAGQSGSWRDESTILLSRADYNLAIANPGFAWESVDSAIDLFRQHPSEVDIDSSQRARLLRHHAYATQGWSALAELISEMPACGFSRVANRIEILMFEVWAKLDSGIDGADHEATKIVEEAVNYGLFGLIARMHAIGVLPITLSKKGPSESSARLVERTFGPSMPPDSAVAQQRATTHLKPAGWDI